MKKGRYKEMANVQLTSELGFSVSVSDEQGGRQVTDAVMVPKESSPGTWGGAIAGLLLGIGMIPLAFFGIDNGDLWTIGFIPIPGIVLKILMIIVGIIAIILSIYTMNGIRKSPAFKVVCARSSNGGNIVTCTFTKKESRYAIAVDDLWIWQDVSSPFSFEITGTGEHNVLLTSGTEKCVDHKKIKLL